MDALAVAIGTAHGTYKSTPKLALDVLEAIAAKVSVPLVLHGGSGLSEQDFRNCIARGIAKVNIFTDISIAAEKAAYEHYAPGVGYHKIMPAVVNAIKEATKEKMRIFDSSKYRAE